MELRCGSPTGSDQDHTWSRTLRPSPPSSCAPCPRRVRILLQVGWQESSCKESKRFSPHSVYIYRNDPHPFLPGTKAAAAKETPPPKKNFLCKHHRRGGPSSGRGAWLAGYGAGEALQPSPVLHFLLDTRPHLPKAESRIRSPP